MIGRWLAFVLTVVALASVFLMAVKDMIPEKHYPEIGDYKPWSKEELKAARKIPLQNGGRVKPLETYAGVIMLSMRGDRRITIIGAGGDKVKIKPTAWLLDVLFRPQTAMKLPTFRVDNSEVLEGVGMDLEGKQKRDRYSYEELIPVLPRLYELGSQYEQLSEGGTKLNLVQKQTLELARSGRSFEALLGYLAFGRTGVELPGAGPDGGGQLQRVSTVMSTAELIQDVVGQAQARGEAPPTHVFNLVQQVTRLSNASKYGLDLIPPDNKTDEEWQTAGNRIWDTMTLASVDPAQAIRDVAGLERMVDAEAGQSRVAVWLPGATESVVVKEWKKESGQSVNKGDVLALVEGEKGTQEVTAASSGELTIKVSEGATGSAETGLGEIKVSFVDAINDWNEGIKERATERNEYRAIPIELRYNSANWFFNALFFAFLPGTIFLMLGWLSIKSNWGKTMRSLVWIFSSVGLVMVIVGMTQRSLIMWRPPVGNLYDTIPFITAGAVLVALVAERLTRRGLALCIAPIIGFVGLTLARRYEFSDSGDSMDPLLAVLRSNFWLSTHVTTVTLGYAAGLAAAAVGHIYVFMRLFKLDNGDKSIRRLLTRMTYGLVCFTLLLSLVGTVLGGIWANYSWGRFWGWDPKENGALLIVIWMLFILHARLGGYLREWGTNLAAMFGAMVVTFSWWHVNLLGVGLHSYGFSESKKQAVFLFYGIEGILLLIGIGMAVFSFFAARAKRRTSGAPTIPQAESTA